MKINKAEKVSRDAIEVEQPRKYSKKVKPLQTLLNGDVFCLIHNTTWDLKEKEVELAPHIYLGEYGGIPLRKAIQNIPDEIAFDHIMADMSEAYFRIEWAKQKSLYGESKKIIETFCSLIGICQIGWAPDPIYYFGYVDPVTEGLLVELLLSERKFKIDDGIERSRRGYLLDSHCIQFIRDAWVNLDLLSKNKHSRLLNAIQFYTEACQSDSKEEAIMHLAIVLESLFGPHDDSKTEVSHQVSMNLSRFLEESADERKAMYSQMKKIYACRSSIVHGDKPRSNLSEMLGKAFEVCSNALFMILESEEYCEMFKNSGARKEFLSELSFS